MVRDHSHMTLATFVNFWHPPFSHCHAQATLQYSYWLFGHPPTSYVSMHANHCLTLRHITYVSANCLKLFISLIYLVLPKFSNFDFPCYITSDHTLQSIAAAIPDRWQISKNAEMNHIFLPQSRFHFTWWSCSTRTVASRLLKWVRKIKVNLLAI